MKDRMVREMGLKDKALPFVNADASLGEINRAMERRGLIIESFAAATRTLLSEGAEVVIQTCGFPNMLLVKQQIRQPDGALVLDGYAVVLRFAEAMMELYKEIGLT